MKLCLTSKAFGNAVVTKKILDELKMETKDIKILFIPTALGGMYPLDKYVNELLSNGFKMDNIIIFDENNCDRYCNLNIDVIYVCGGNTFTLVDRINKCGFGLEIEKYLNKGVIYLGRSAGTHLVTKNIEHIIPFDDNDIGLKDYAAMGLLDGIIFCHYSEARESYYDEAVKRGKYKVYKITDEEMLVCDRGHIYKT